MPLHLGIDASNLRAGGGLTHISQLLAHGDPVAHGFDRVTIWGGAGTLARIEDRPWLNKIHVPALDRALPARVFWQKFLLSRALKRAGCDALFAPGGILPAFSPLPSVVMSQNLLPFERREYRRAPALSFHRFKIAQVRRAQLPSHRRADGIIFLSRYARDAVVAELGQAPRNEAIIAHGLEPRFLVAPRAVRRLADASEKNPLRILYISTVFYYKHPWNVADAAGMLRKKGLPVTVEFVGDGIPGAQARLREAIARNDPEGRFLFYRGGVPFAAIHEKLREADLFVFASSCETIASTVIEAMASGLPIASSDRGPLKEVLGDAASYFNPEQPADIARAIERLLLSPDERARLAREGHARAQGYSWPKCANETFSFLFRAIDSTFRERKTK